MAAKPVVSPSYEGMHYVEMPTSEWSTVMLFRAEDISPLLAILARARRVKKEYIGGDAYVVHELGRVLVTTSQFDPGTTHICQSPSETEAFAKFFTTTRNLCTKDGLSPMEPSVEDFRANKK